MQVDESERDLKKIQDSYQEDPYKALGLFRVYNLLAKENKEKRKIKLSVNSASKFTEFADWKEVHIFEIPEVEQLLREKS